jgi:lipoprotein-anchoring transpeptidase ErfK/SrfK
MPGGPFTLNLRMIASGPAATIDVTVRCHRTNGKATVAYGPTTIQSGVDLLPVPPDSGAGRRIVYSVSAQQLWAIEADDSVAKTHLVSGRRMLLSGGRSQYGTFQLFRKAKGWGCGGGCPNFLGFRHYKDETIGFHQIPFDRHGPYESLTELGQPRSHGCVRQSAEDALWLYNWAVIGDVVVVLP